MKRVYVKLLALILVSLFFLLGCGETTRTKPEKEEWKMGAGGWLGILDEENIYYFNNFTRSLYAKNIESGREILLFPWLLTCQDVTKIGGSYYFLVPDRIDGGRTLWKKNTFFIPTRLLSNAVNKYAVLGDTVIVKEWDNDDNLVLSFYTDDFRHRKVLCERNVIDFYCIDQNVYYLHTTREGTGMLDVINLETKERKQLCMTGDAYEIIGVWDGALYYLSANSAGYICCKKYNIKTNATENVYLPSEGEEFFLRDHALWYSEVNAPQKIVKLDLKTNEITTYDIPDSVEAFTVHERLYVLLESGTVEVY